MNTKISSAFTALFALALAACSPHSSGGQRPASGLGVLSTPPEKIAIAIGVPKALRLTTGDASLRIAFKGRGSSSTVQMEEIAPLQFTATAAGAPKASAGETVYVARPAANDAARLAVVQKRIIAMRSLGRHATASLTVAITGGCYVGTVPPTMPVSTWLLTDPADGFLQLTHRADMFRAMDAESVALLRARLRPC